MEQNKEYLINTPSIKIKSATAGIVIFGTIALWVILKFIIGSYGNEVIGSFFEKSEYETKYWVYLQPDEAQTKNYRIIGDVWRIAGSGGDGEGDYGSPATYNLNRAYWENGGYTDFDDCDITEATAKDGHAYCKDDEDRSYEIRLGEKVKK